MLHINKRRVFYLIILVVILAGLLYGGVSGGLFKSIPEMFSGIKISYNTIFQLIIMIVFVLIVSTLALFLIGILKPLNNRASTMISLVSSVIKYISALVIICWGLTIIGVPITTVAGTVGVLSIVIGLGAESLIADVISGVFMIFENQYNVGDIVEVNNFRGEVKSIGIRTTAIQDVGGNIKIINNSNMTNILNRSDHFSVSVCSISISYNTDLEALEAKMPAILRDMYERNARVFKAEPVYLGVDKLADFAIVLKFCVDVAEVDIYDGNRLLNHEVLLAIKKAGVEIPFPQMDVHCK